jgi:hypothetical protein
MTGLAKKLLTALATVLLAGCASGVLGLGGSSWKEEVMQHDEIKIVVERSVERGGRHEIGQKPPIREQSLSFTPHGSNKPITWGDHYSEDVSGANFLPMLLDMANGIPYLVVHPMGCLSYNKWGRPNPPYVIFKYDSGTWQRIALQELPREITTPNLVFSMPDIEAEKLGKGLIPAEAINKLIRGYRQPHYRSIIREPISPEEIGCPEMVSDGNGGWLGIDWFSDTPDFETCTKVCEMKNVAPGYCPCKKFHKGP